MNRPQPRASAAPAGTAAIVAAGPLALTFLAASADSVDEALTIDGEEMTSRTGSVEGHPPPTPDSDGGEGGAGAID